jgi:hypothetical protein
VAGRSAQLDQDGTIAAGEQLIPARSMHPIIYQSHIATAHVRGNIRLLNTKCSMFKVMELLEPLAARDRGGIRFTYAIWRLDDTKASSPILDQLWGDRTSRFSKAFVAWDPPCCLLVCRPKSSPLVVR